MASVKKRPDGRWRARYRDEGGREHARHFARKVDAQDWLNDVTASLLTGRYVDPRAGRVTFRKYAERWRAAQAHRGSTRDRVERSLRKHVYGTLGDLPMSSIRTSTVQGWVTATADVLAASTMKIVYGHVRAIFAAAVRDRVIAVTPCDGTRLPEIRRKRIEPLGVDQLDRLREGLPPRFRAVVDMVAGSGLRQGEVFGLEVEHLDFLRDRGLRVEQQLLTLPGEPPFLAPPKTAQSYRMLPLAKVTLEALAAHLAEFGPVDVDVEDRTDPRTPRRRTARLVFGHEDGRAMARHDWPFIWRPVAQSVGLPPRSGLHLARHTYASLLIRYGESVKVVQERMGHSSASVTLDVYGHLWPDSDDRTREAIEAVLRAPADSVRTVGTAQ